MATQTFVLIFSLFFASVLTKSLDPSFLQEEDPEYGKYFQGDLILNAEQLEAINSLSRNGLIDTTYRWPNKTVVYKMNAHHTMEQQLYIKMAQWAIESVSCIKFVSHTNESYYINLEANVTGCHSYIGFQANVQTLNLAPNELGKGCFRLGTIVHEFLHEFLPNFYEYVAIPNLPSDFRHFIVSFENVALGFYHMQSAYDRDDFVQIKWEHIIPEYKSNFERYDESEVTHFNATYDYDSILHYSAYAFTKDKNEATIVPLDETYLGKIGQRNHLNEVDIQRLNDMYECNGERPDARDFAKKAFEFEKERKQF